MIKKQDDRTKKKRFSSR